MIHVGRDRIMCRDACDKGTCSNKASLERAELEAMILRSLERNLLTPERAQISCEEYTAHMNRLVAERNAGRDAAQAELARIDRRMEKLVDAILDGVPGSQVKDRMAALETRKTELQAQLETSPRRPTSLHPNLAQHYRSQIVRLRELLAEEGGTGEAAEALRSLIDRIVLSPVEGDAGRGPRGVAGGDHGFGGWAGKPSR